MSKTVLVTGATGFIGRHVVKKLRGEDIAVYGVSRNGGIVEDVVVEALDLADKEQVKAWQQGKTFEAIIHLASEIPELVTGPAAKKCFTSNVTGMMNVLELACSSNCYLVYSSGSSIYGTSSETVRPLSEAQLPKPENLYTSSKYVGDILCEQMARSDGLLHTTLRISAPYGPGCKRATVVNIFLQAALESRDLTLYGSGARTQDFTYIDDVVEAIWLALCKRPVGTFNIASGIPVSMKTLAETVLQVVTNSSSQIVYSGKPDPQENYRALFSIEKALEKLDWWPRSSLIEGLRATAETLTQQKIC